jgi:hypothetical protein
LCRWPDGALISASIGSEDAVDHVVHVDKIASLLESITRSKGPSDTL